MHPKGTWTHNLIHKNHNPHPYGMLEVPFGPMTIGCTNATLWSWMLRSQLEIISINCCNNFVFDNTIWTPSWFLVLKQCIDVFWLWNNTCGQSWLRTHCQSQNFGTKAWLLLFFFLSLRFLFSPPPLLPLFPIFLRSGLFMNLFGRYGCERFWCTCKIIKCQSYTKRWPKGYFSETWWIFLIVSYFSTPWHHLYCYNCWAHSFQCSNYLYFILLGGMLMNHTLSTLWILNTYA